MGSGSFQRVAELVERGGVLVLLLVLVLGEERSDVLVTFPAFASINAPLRPTCKTPRSSKNGTERHLLCL